MRGNFRTKVFILMLALGIATPILSQEVAIGRTVDSLLDYARSTNPDYASMRYEADAAIERVVPAGALPDPRFRMELQDITKFGEQNATLNPSRVGSTKYTVLQEIPWYGKRDLKREIAELEAEGAQGRVRGTWTEITAKLKIAHALSLIHIYTGEAIPAEHVPRLFDRFYRVDCSRQRFSEGVGLGLAITRSIMRAHGGDAFVRSDQTSTVFELIVPCQPIGMVPIAN